MGQSEVCLPSRAGVVLQRRNTVCLRVLLIEALSNEPFFEKVYFTLEVRVLVLGLVLDHVGEVLIIFSGALFAFYCDRVQ